MRYRMAMVAVAGGVLWAGLAPARAGGGDWAFAPEPDWGKTDRAIGPTHGGIAVDRAGRVFVSTDGPQAILVYAPDGRLAGSIATNFPGIHSLLLREEGGVEYLYAAHLAGHQAVKLTLDGAPVWTLGYPAESGLYKSAAEFKPTAVAVAPDGALFVADGYGKSVIHKFDAGRAYLKTFSGAGTPAGAFRTCHGLAVDARGGAPRLLVCDRENRRLVRFDLEGNFVDVIAAGLRRPCALAFCGEVVAVAELEGRVTLLDADNRTLSVLGDNEDKSQQANFNVPPDHWHPGVFTAAHGLAFDAAGNLYVQDWNRTGRLTKLARVKRVSSNQ